MTRIINKNSLLTINERSQDNVILIDKPIDWTSFDVVKKVKFVGNFRKAGHAGTLDPFAKGLLIVGTGKETKSLSKWSNADKTYEAVIEFGKQTNTYDITGEVTEIKDTVNIDWDEIRIILKSFIGQSEQIPPMFSAKKINGVRLYKLARKGKEVERKSHLITIHAIDINHYTENEITITVQCSKGTYLRSIAHDLGIKSNHGAYLKALRRQAIGNFSVKDALSLGQFESFWRTLN